jgi:hypothetical protein
MADRLCKRASVLDMEERQKDKVMKEDLNLRDGGPCDEGDQST